VSVIKILFDRTVRSVIIGAVRVLVFGLGKHDATWPPDNLRSVNYYYEKAIGHIEKRRAGIPDSDGLDHDFCVVANIILARMVEDK